MIEVDLFFPSPASPCQGRSSYSFCTAQQQEKYNWKMLYIISHCAVRHRTYYFFQPYSSVFYPSLLWLIFKRRLSFSFLLFSASFFLFLYLFLYKGVQGEKFLFLFPFLSFEFFGGFFRAVR